MDKDVNAIGEDDPDAAPLLAGPYDAPPVAEADLWFLPGPGAPRVDLPVAGARDWRQAQAENAWALADLAEALGGLAELMRHVGGAGRLAMSEAAALSWWAGDRVSPDRLAASEAGHLQGLREDAQALARAGWARRRLAGGPGPQQDLAAFLGRNTADIADTETILAAMQGLHPIVGTARVFAAWRGIGAVEGIEAAVLAARLAVTPGRGAVFLPLALGGARALTAGGGAATRLPRWLSGATTSVLAARLELERLAAWQRRAAAETADLSGRTPPRLIAALAAHPVLDAGTAEAATGVARASVQRNLDLFAARGLVREITGQGRYRLWCAAI